jgi:GMP reductase
MVNEKLKFDFDDLLIQPISQSLISSRKEVTVFDGTHMLPLFTAPMDTVVDMKNIEIFSENKIYSIVPRTYDRPPENNQWKAIGLKEFEHFYINNDICDLFSVDPEKAKLTMNHKILIDIANGHMEKLVHLIKKAKEKYGNKLTLMVGNVANPSTYFELSKAGADYIRVGIGNGGGCLTSQQVGVGYPLASLIYEIYQERNIRSDMKPNDCAKIVADGGMKNYSDIIKALALGANYVMIGSIFNRALESAGETYGANIHHETWLEPGEKVDQYSEGVKNAFKNGAKFYKKFRGMSTKGVQKLLGNDNLKTSEGVTRMNPVEYTIEGWTENFKHYLASAMSYTGTSTLNEFIGKVDLNLITQSSFNRFNK